jgi:hypothetical protein
MAQPDSDWQWSVALGFPPWGDFPRSVLTCFGPESHIGTAIVLPLYRRRLTADDAPQALLHAGHQAR